MCNIQTVERYCGMCAKLFHHQITKSDDRSHVKVRLCSDLVEMVVPLCPECHSQLYDLIAIASFAGKKRADREDAQTAIG